MASPDLVHFATMTVTLGESFVIKGGPVGTRIVAEVETEDDEFIYMEYSGRIDLTTGKVVSAPLFQTGAEEYDWMNRMQAVGVGQNGPDSLVYELYEVVGG